MVNVGDEIVVVDGYYVILDEDYSMTVIHVISDDKVVVLEVDENGVALDVYIADLIEDNFHNGETWEKRLIWEIHSHV